MRLEIPDFPDWVIECDTTVPKPWAELFNLGSQISAHDSVDEAVEAFLEKMKDTPEFKEWKKTADKKWNTHADYVCIRQESCY